MAERWKYAERNHPPYCTCFDCKGDSSRPRSSQPSNQLRTTLESWRSSNFDPHHILGVPPDASKKWIVEAHRRWILAYHPDKHQIDPLATELTKRINVARDELLGKRRGGSQSQREQQRRQAEAQRRARETERRKQEEEREQRAAKRRKRDEGERRRREETERIMRDLAGKRQEAERRGGGKGEANAGGCPHSSSPTIHQDT